MTLSAVMAASLGACAPVSEAPVPEADAGARLPSLAEELASESPARSRWAARYYEGYVAEVLRADLGGAREAYEDVVAEANAAAPHLAARAALRLAELEALAGQRRKALELMARAAILGRDSLDIVEQADSLAARLGALRSADIDVRGPPLGAALASVSAQAAERFARAEELLRAYHRVRLEPRLEQLRAGVRAKESAMDAAVRAYRATVALGEPVATVAAELRVASIHHDLALSLMFDLPPELEPSAAARLRRELRASAIGHLRRAQAAYRRCLDSDTAPGPASERWVSTAKRGLRSVEDLLGGD